MVAMRADIIGKPAGGPTFACATFRRTNELVQVGRMAGKRCDNLLVELAKSDFNAAETTSMVLLPRFYKRLGGHLLNVLSSVIMPLHKVDFYDEHLVMLGTTPESD